MVAEKKARQASAGGQDGSRGKQPGPSADTHVAASLRIAYEEAIREDVPAEFKDLLDKLS